MLQPRPYIPAAQHHYYIAYSVNGGSKMTYTAKAHDAEEAVSIMRQDFARGDMLNAPAWHEVQIAAVQKNINPRLEAKIIQQSKITRHFW